MTPTDSLLVRYVSGNQKSRECLGGWLGPGCAGRGEGAVIIGGFVLASVYGSA